MEKNPDPWVFANRLGFEVIETILPLHQLGRIEVKRDHKTIYLDKRLGYTQRRCRLAHELGHYFTSPWEVLTYRPGSMDQVLELSKYEYRAEKWAGEYLIFNEELKYALSVLEDIFLSDLAERFEVTLEFMRFRMELYKANKYNHAGATTSS